MVRKGNRWNQTQLCLASFAHCVFLGRTTPESPEVSPALGQITIWDQYDQYVTPVCNPLAGQGLGRGGKTSYL